MDHERKEMLRAAYKDLLDLRTTDSVCEILQSKGFITSNDKEIVMSKKNKAERNIKLYLVVSKLGNSGYDAFRMALVTLQEIELLEWLSDFSKVSFD